MKKILFCWIVAASFHFFAHAEEAAGLNRLTEAEEKGGWRLLFNGTNLDGWRSYRKAEAPKQGWRVQSGCLRLTENEGGGDLITTEQFSDFELRWEWQLSVNGNNGIKYLVTEDRPSAPGPEYQMIDDSIHAIAGEERFRTASLYHVLAPDPKVKPNPPGQWNFSRLVIRGKKVEHWLNGKKVLAYELESPRLLSAIQQSKFKDAPGFGKKIKGHIMLTDHKDEVCYRNIKIRGFSPR